ncbi:MAG: hypothetical protein ABW346_01680, partial [Terrimicrobium sp.]
VPPLVTLRNLRRSERPNSPDAASIVFDFIDDFPCAAFAGFEAEKSQTSLFQNAGISQLAL